MRNLFFLLAAATFFTFFLQAQENIQIYPFAYQNQWGLIDSERKVILEPSLDKVELLWNNNQADGSVVGVKEGKQGLINGYGKWLIKPKMDSIDRKQLYYFPEVIWVIKKGKYGLMDVGGKKGKWLVKPRFTRIESAEGRKIALIPVAIDDQWGVVNNNGEMVAECEYDEVVLFETWSDYPYIKLLKDGVVTYLDAFGAVKDTEEMEHIEMMDEGWDDVAIESMSEGTPTPDPRSQTMPGEAGETVVTYETYKNGAYQIEKRILVPGEYQVMKVVLENYYAPAGIRSITIKKDGKFGFFGPHDNTLGTPPVYDYTKAIHFPNHPVILLKIGDKKGLADRNGRLIFPAYFDDIRSIRNLLFVEHESGYQGYANYKGQIFLPASLELVE